MRRTQKLLLGVVGALSALTMMACEVGPTPETRDLGDITGVEEIGQPISAFSAYSWDAGTGALTLNFDGSETLLIVGKHVVSGAIVVNDVALPATTGTNLKRLFISGQAAGETVILDFANGTFAPGTDAGVGIWVDLGTGANSLKVRGAGATGDTISVGGVERAAFMAYNIDAWTDISVAATGPGTVAYTFSLGGGNDVFTGSATQYGVTGPYMQAAGTVAATGTITAVDEGSGIADGDTFTIGDGVRPPTVFEFEVAGGVTAGRVPVAIAALDTAATIAPLIRAAINGVGASLAVTAAVPVGAAVGLTNDALGAFGNVAITQTSTMTIVGMTGGVGAGGTGVTVYGGLGDDTLTGSAGNDTLNGDLGTDLLSGGNVSYDSDTISGGASFADGGGLDTVTYASRTGDLAITIGAGADDGEATETDDLGVDVEIVQGGSGADTFTGAAGNQIFYGNGGNDTFLMGSAALGNDQVYGGAGTDTVSYAARTAAVTVTMDGTAGDGETGESDNVGSDIENFVCQTGVFACTVTGNALDNSFTCGGGLDKLNGGAGDDSFVFGANGSVGAGADEITGGTGLDTVDFRTFGVGVNLKMDGTASTTMSKKIMTDVENVRLPDSVNTLVCNAADNRVYGGTAADTVDLGGGDDFFEGGGGADSLTCGDGSDIWINTGASGSAAVTPSDCEL